jgi:hypothetical protein
VQHFKVNNEFRFKNVLINLTGFIAPLNSARWLHYVSFVTEPFLRESINYPRIKPLNFQFSALPHSVRDN